MNTLLAAIAIDGQTLGMLLLSIVSGVIILIFGIRKWFSYQSKEDLALKVVHKKQLSILAGRNKYPEVDAFKLSNTFFSLGIAIALVTAILTFGWTIYGEAIEIPVYDGVVEIDEITDAIRLPPPPPPPPPPLPPMFEPVIDDLLEEEEIEDFISQSIDIDSEINQEDYKFQKGIVDIDIDEEIIEKVEPPIIFAEQMPRFPGCEDIGGNKVKKQSCAEGKLMQFVYENIKYPAIARENGIQGRCFVTFVVEKSGEVSNVKLLRDIGGQCGKESLRVVNLMIKKNILWTAGKQRGRKVRVQFNLPIQFKLQ